MIEFDPVLKSTVHLGLPVTTWLIIAWVALAAVNTHNKDLWRAKRAGELPPGDHTPPDWMSFLVLPQYAALVMVALVNGSLTIAASVWGLTFLVAVIARFALFSVGAILLIPYAYLTRKSRAHTPYTSAWEEDEA